MPRDLPVLVLETDTPLQGLLGAVLRRDGYAPAFVRDGHAALRMLRRRDFAAFVVDISIAPSTLEDGARRGIGFIHHLQRHTPAMLPRVVVLTGLHERELPRDLPAECRFLSKPFDLDAFRAAISQCAAPAA